MATGEQISRQLTRQQGERTAAANEVMASRSRAELTKSINDIYTLGRIHENERLRLRLEIERRGIVINWPGTECPDQPHAHLQFEVDDAVVLDDSRN